MQTREQREKTLVGAIHPDVLTFTVGRDRELDLQLLEWDCIGSAAHVTMLSRMRHQPLLFSPTERDSVVAALVEIMQSGRDGNFTITAADQDVHLAVERSLTERLGEIGKRIHTGRSRNDQVALDLRLHARNALLALSEEALTLIRALLKLAKRHYKIPMVGRTHLQPAMPSSVGLWASAYAEGLLDDLLTVEAAYNYSDRSPLGSAAGYGVPLPIDRELTAHLLGFAAPIHNVFYASNTRGKCESIILAALVQVMLTASRLAEDLIIFSMPEFGYFSLPPELCTGSSIMPQKYNPDVLELIRAKAAQVMGHHATACTIVKALPGGYNRDLQETKELYLEGLETTRATLRILLLMAEGIGINQTALRNAFTPGVFATDRALELVAGGLPFREAYREVRENLAGLAATDPDAAIAAKTHLGATAGLDLSLLDDRARALQKSNRQRQRKLYNHFSRLLGVEYPTLTPCKDA